MGYSGAFAKANAMFAAIAAAMALPEGERQDALSRIAPYHSRGKGRGTAGRNYLKGANRSTYAVHQGPREGARRVRQMAEHRL